MRATVDRAELVEALALCDSVAKSVGGVIPILSHVKLEVRDEALRIVATNLDVTVITSVATAQNESLEAGALIVSCRDLLDAVRACDANLVSLQKGEARILVACGSAKFELPIRDADDFPVEPSADDKGGVAIPLEVLHQVIKVTGFATTQEETRFSFSGIHLECTRKACEFVATDGHRLALYALHDVTADEFETMIPIFAFKTIAKLTGSGDVGISTGDMLHIEAGHVSVLIRVVDGRKGSFPKWRGVVKSDGDLPHVMITKRADLLAAVRRVGKFASYKMESGNRSKGVRVSFESGIMTISGKDVDRGVASDTLRVDFAGVTDFGIDAGYLAQALEAFDTDSVEMRFGTNRDQIQLRPEPQQSGREELQVVMPMGL